MRLATAERAMVAAMSADPVRDEDVVHGLMDPRAVAEGLEATAQPYYSPTEVMPTYSEVPAVELTFAEVVMGATRWNRA